MGVGGSRSSPPEGDSDRGARIRVTEAREFFAAGEVREGETVDERPRRGGQGIGVGLRECACDGRADVARDVRDCRGPRVAVAVAGLVEHGAKQRRALQGESDIGDCDIGDLVWGCGRWLGAGESLRKLLIADRGDSGDERVSIGVVALVQHFKRRSQERGS